MEFKKYKRTNEIEMHEYNPDMMYSKEFMDRVSISKADLENGSPKRGDMIARNPEDHGDMWLVAEKYFKEKFISNSVSSVLKEELQRKLYNEVLGHMMSDTDGEDFYADYEKLLTVEDTTELADNYITVWYPFDTMNIADFIENVESEFQSLKKLYYDILEDSPISKVDFGLLKDQKNELLILLNNFDDDSLLGIALNGILNLIDSIQDYAVDVLGRKENEVFNLSEEED